MFWLKVFKYKKQKYNLMKKINKLRKEYNSLNNENDEWKEKRFNISKEIELKFQKIDEIERDLHEFEDMKMFGRKSFMYCVCGNDLNNGRSDIVSEQEDGSLIYSCNKCHTLTHWSFDIGPCPVCMETIYKTMDKYTVEEKKKELTVTNIDTQLIEYRKSLENDLYSKLNISDEIKDKYEDI